MLEHHHDRVILWGDNAHNDAAALRHLLRGGIAYDVRSDSMIAAPTLDDLPPGSYRTAPIDQEMFGY